MNLHPSQNRWNPNDYARHSTAQFQWARELIAKLQLRGDEAVLDIGCGDGKVTVLLAQATPRGHVIGIDSSPDMITLARRSSRAPNLEFVEMDARALMFQDSFDVVFSSAVLHWIKDHRALLRGVRASLKRGGRILFQMGGRGNAQEVFMAFEKMTACSDRWKSFFANFEFPYGFYGVEEYTQWLREAGLEPHRVELISKDMVYPHREGMAGWIRTTWLPYTERLPANLHRSFIDEMIETYLRDHPAAADGTIHTKMVRLEVEATNPY